MSSVEMSGESAAGAPPVNAGEFRLEVVVLPVSDVDRAKEFYGGLGWRLDADVARGISTPFGSVHASGLRVLDPIWHEHRVWRARLGPGPVPGRLRHRSCA